VSRATYTDVRRECRPNGVSEIVILHLALLAKKLDGPMARDLQVDDTESAAFVIAIVSSASRFPPTFGEHR
jgi:hypothetical protein